MIKIQETHLQSSWPNSEQKKQNEERKAKIAKDLVASSQSFKDLIDEAVKATDEEE